MARANKILIVVTGEPPASVAEHRGGYVSLMREAVGHAWDGDFDSVDVRLGVPHRRDDVAALVITGSSSSVHAREPWILDAEEWLAALVHEGTAALGVCFGHQILAQALGGRVEKNPRGREMSTIEIDVLADDPLFEGLGARWDVNACHSDTVVELPPGASTLARSNQDAHQVLRFSSRCYGVQFHPELDGALMRAYVDARRDDLLAEGLDPELLRAQAKDTPAAQRVMRNFVKHVVKRA